MKWYKRDTDAHRSEGLLYVKAKWGRDWCDRWSEILEMVAEKMDETERCHLQLPVSEWSKRLDCTAKKLSAFLLDTAQTLSIRYEESAGMLLIEIPNLLKKRDNHTRQLASDLQATCKQDKEIRVRVRDKSKNTPDSAKALSAPKGPTVSPELAEAVAVWNQSRAPNWKAVHTVTKPIAMQFANAKKHEQFDLPKIIARARGSDFLTSANFVDLLWILKPSKRTGVPKWQEILDGYHDNPNRNNKRAGNLTDTGIDF